MRRKSGWNQEKNEALVARVVPSKMNYRLHAVKIADFRQQVGDIVYFTEANYHTSELAARYAR
jgi:hypothetical protein